MKKVWSFIVANYGPDINQTFFVNHVNFQTNIKRHRVFEFVVVLSSTH